MGRPGRRNNNRMAPYFVQMREAERRLLRAALEEASGDTAQVASMLGVTRYYVLARSRFLGGVLGDEPKHEPPGTAMDAWNHSGTPRRKAATEGHADPAEGDESSA